MSAIFFCSNNMNKARISNITQTKNGMETEKIKKKKTMDKIFTTTQIQNRCTKQQKEKINKMDRRNNSTQDNYRQDYTR